MVSYPLSIVTTNKQGNEYIYRKFMMSYSKEVFNQCKLIHSVLCLDASTTAKYFFTIFKIISNNTPTPDRMSLNILTSC